jgi:hypothetical protein
VTESASFETAYLKAAIEFADARNRNNHKLSNKAHDALMKAAKKIRLNRLDQGAAFFKSLLTHEMLHVSCWAAFHLIPLDWPLAKGALIIISESPDSEAQFSAEMVLKELKNGSLDPEWW